MSLQTSSKAERYAHRIEQNSWLASITQALAPEKQHSSLSESTLIETIRGAIHRKVDHWLGKYSIAERSDADDITQDILIRLLLRQTAIGFDPGSGPLQGYLEGLVRWSVVGHVRKKAIERNRLKQWARDRESFKYPPPHSIIEVNERIAEIESHIDALSPCQRHALRREVYDFPLPETGTAQQRRHHVNLHRARGSLRRKFHWGT
jgi:DNA-directed RNA polymerase specialized sigma24 family protein